MNHTAIYLADGVSLSARLSYTASLGVYLRQHRIVKAAALYENFVP